MEPELEKNRANDRALRRTLTRVFVGGFGCAGLLGVTVILAGLPEELGAVVVGIVFATIGGVFMIQLKRIALFGRDLRERREGSREQ